MRLSARPVYWSLSRLRRLRRLRPHHQKRSRRGHICQCARRRVVRFATLHNAWPSPPALCGAPFLWLQWCMTARDSMRQWVCSWKARLMMLYHTIIWRASMRYVLDWRIYARRALILWMLAVRSTTTIRQWTNRWMRMTQMVLAEPVVLDLYLDAHQRSVTCCEGSHSTCTVEMTCTAG